MGDSWRAHVMVVPRCFGSLTEQAIALTSAICPLILLSALLSTLPIALEVTYFQDTTIYWLIADVLCHFSGYDPFLHSWPIALNFRCGLSEVSPSLLLIATFRLPPLLILWRYSQAHRPLDWYYVYVNAYGDCPKTYTRRFLYSRTINLWQTTFKDNCTSQYVYSCCQKLQILRDRITQLSILSLIMSTSRLALPIVVGLNHWMLDLPINLLLLLWDYCKISTKWK